MVKAEEGSLIIGVTQACRALKIAHSSYYYHRRKCGSKGDGKPHELGETCLKQGIVKGQLTIHADRGSSMKSKSVALLLSDLDITKTHSRPHVSDDNPYSEAQFKTLKYCPAFPCPIRSH